MNLKIISKKKNKVNMKLFKFYENYIFRKLKLNSYINRLKSDQQLINRFKKYLVLQKILLYV